MPSQDKTMIRSAQLRGLAAIPRTTNLRYGGSTLAASQMGASIIIQEGEAGNQPPNLINTAFCSSNQPVFR